MIIIFNINVTGKGIKLFLLVNKLRTLPLCTIFNGLSITVLIISLLSEVIYSLLPRKTAASTIFNINKSCRRTASSPAGYILYCNIFIIKPYNIGHTDLDVFVCKSFCHLDIIIQV